jgi:hypothetical protein
VGLGVAFDNEMRHLKLRRDGRDLLRAGRAAALEAIEKLAASSFAGVCLFVTLLQAASVVSRLSVVSKRLLPVAGGVI